MTLYATHRFNVGQLVSCPANAPTGCTVLTQIAGRDGPAYEVVFEGGARRKVVQEGELTYHNGAEPSGSAASRVGAELAPRAVHSCPRI